MRLLLLVALAGCDINLFSKPENDATDIPCSSDGHCPPGQTCVQGEYICHRPCTRPGPCMGGNCECNNNNNNGSNDTCDADLFCRPSCNGGGGGGNMCDSSGCRDPSLVCDPQGQICRPRCSGTNTCSGGFSCVSLGPCAICRPSPAPLPDGGMPGPDMATPAAPVFVTHEAMNVRFIALDGSGNIFWNNDQGVLFCPLASCNSPQPIGLSHGVNGLAVANNNVVWSDSQGNVNVCPTSGCATPTVLASGQGSLGPVASDGNAAFWMAARPSPQLLRCDLAGCGGTPGSLISGTYSGNLATTLAVSGGFAYWPTMNNVVRCSSGGCIMPVTVDTLATPIMAVALAVPKAYFSGGDCIDVCDVDTLNCTMKLACNGMVNIVQSLAADDTDIFWSIGSTLRHCPIPCTNMPRDIGNAQMASVVAMDGDFFYWGDLSAGTISKLAR